MNQLGLVSDRGLNSGSAEFGGISLAIIMQRIMVGGDQKGRRQALKIRLAQGLGIFMAATLIDIAVVNRIFGRKPRRISLRDVGALGQVTAQARIVALWWAGLKAMIPFVLILPIRLGWKS